MGLSRVSKERGAEPSGEFPLGVDGRDEPGHDASY